MKGGSRPATRMARCSPSATTAPRQPGHRHQAWVRRRHHGGGDDAGPGPRRHQRDLRRGERRARPSTTATGTTSPSPAPAAPSRFTWTEPRSGRRPTRAPAAAITTGAAGSYQNIGTEGNWVQQLRHTPTSNIWRATFDEFRISNTARSSDWIVTDYNTMKTPSSTYTLGSEVGTTCGGGTVGSGEACDDGNVAQRRRLQRHVHRSRPATPASGRRPASARPPAAMGSSPAAKAATTATDQRRRLQQHLHRRERIPLQRLAQRLHQRRRLAVHLLQDHQRRSNQGGNRVGSHHAEQLSDAVQRDRQQPWRTPANSGRVQSSSGYDIIFRGTDSTTCGGATACTLSHEIEKYDGTTGQLIAWVNIPVLNSADRQLEHLVRNHVRKPVHHHQHRAGDLDLDSSFTGVWHLSKDPSDHGPRRTRRRTPTPARQRRHDRHRPDRFGRGDQRKHQLRLVQFRNVAEHRQRGGFHVLGLGQDHGDATAPSSRCGRAATATRSSTSWWASTAPRPTQAR